MTPKEALIAARALITTPEAWTQGAFARTTKGAPTFPEQPNATCFCLMGALSHITPGKLVLRGRALELLANQLPSDCYSFAAFNDRHSHSDVLALLDRAIAAT